MPKQQQKKTVTVTRQPKKATSQTTTVTVTKSPKKSSGRRPRRRRANGNQMSSTSARTSNDVQTMLAKGVSSMKMGNSPWMGCRLSAMAPRSVPSIPDGQSGKHINVCFYSTHSITFDSGAFGAALRLYLHPWLPAPLLVNASNNKAKVDGQICPTDAKLCSGHGSGLLVNSATDTSPGATTQNTYGAAKVRFSSIGMRIRYTGPAQTASGVLVVSKCPVSLNQQVTVTTSSATTTPPATGVSLGEYKSDNTVAMFAPIGTVGYVFDGPNPGVGVINATCGMQMYRPEQGAIVRLSHEGKEYKSVPWFEKYAAVVEDYTGDATKDVNNSLITNDVGGSYILRSRGGLAAYDNDWTSACATISGYGDDATFMVEVCVCAEVVPMVASVMYAMTKEGSVNRPSELIAAENIIREQGPGQPLVR